MIVKLKYIGSNDIKWNETVKIGLNEQAACILIRS